jgi:hypothetical protein
MLRVIRWAKNAAVYLTVGTVMDIPCFVVNGPKVNRTAPSAVMVQEGSCNRSAQ